MTDYPPPILQWISYEYYAWQHKGLLSGECAQLGVNGAIDQQSLSLLHERGLCHLCNT